MVKNLPASAGDIKDMGLIPGLGRFPGGGNGNSLQYSWLENSMDRGASWVTIYGGHKEWDMTEHACIHKPEWRSKAEMVYGGYVGYMTFQGRQLK